MAALAKLMEENRIAFENRSDSYADYVSLYQNIHTYRTARPAPVKWTVKSTARRKQVQPETEFKPRTTPFWWEE